mgnify:CR=1 FL=1
MHVIAYTSESQIPQAKLEKSLSEIEDVAQKKNSEMEITGALFYLNSRFLQIIEGEKAALEDLMKTLHHAPRHSDIVYLKDSPIEKRSMATWDMEIFNLETDKKQSLKTLQIITETFQQNLFDEKKTDDNADMLISFYKSVLK